MAYRSFSLLPALSENILSDRFTQMDKLFSRLTGEKPLSDTPAYNLLQTDKEHYELTVSVPGYQKNELDISVLNNQLTINGKVNIESHEADNQEKVSRKWIHKGITKPDFYLSFNLDHRIHILSANLDNGLLILQFTYDIPETEKPKKISLSQNESCVIEQATK